MRKLNEMFHIEGEQLIKTSNGQPVPEDEPLFILRGRDAQAFATIVHYRDLCESQGTPKQRVTDLDAVIEKFLRFRNANRERMKTPGVTLGK